MSRHPTPFSNPAEVKALTRRLFPALGAKRNAQVVGVSVRSVYRWGGDLVDTGGRERTAAAGRAVQLRAVDARAGDRVVLRERVAIDPWLHRCHADVRQQQEDRHRHDEERSGDPAKCQHSVSILAP